MSSVTIYNVSLIKWDDPIAQSKYEHSSASHNSRHLQFPTGMFNGAFSQQSFGKTGDHRCTLFREPAGNFILQHLRKQALLRGRRHFEWRRKHSFHQRDGTKLKGCWLLLTWDHEPLARFLTCTCICDSLNHFAWSGHYNEKKNT